MVAVHRYHAAVGDVEFAVSERRTESCDGDFGTEECFGSKNVIAEW